MCAEDVHGLWLGQQVQYSSQGMNTKLMDSISNIHQPVVIVESKSFNHQFKWTLFLSGCV